MRGKLISIYASSSTLHPRQKVTQSVGCSFQLAQLRGLRACLALVATGAPLLVYRQQPKLPKRPFSTSKAHL